MNNNLLDDKILELNSKKPNVYKKELDIINGFVKIAAEERNITYSTKKAGKMIKTELFIEDQYIGGYTGMKPSTTHRSAFHLCKDKFLLEKHISQMDIPVLKSEIFYEDEKLTAKDFIEKNEEQNFVLKPLSLSGGRGIEFKVNEKNFETSWLNSMEIQKLYESKPLACIIQPFIKGFDLRVTIIEGVFSAALLRIPAHIIGDGESSIAKLIDKKNEMKQNSEYFNNKLIKISDALINILKEQQLTLDAIVDKDKVVHLSYVGNLVAGADSFDVTDEISEGLKKLAVDTVASIPGLYSAGVDIMAYDFTKDEGFVIEVNTNPNNRMHELPLRGQQQSPAKDYINSLIINYKILNNLSLSNEELQVNNEYQKFLKLKSDFAVKYFEYNKD